MNPGPLDKRCRIEQKSVTQDATYGTQVITWVPLAVVWCSLQDVLPSRSEAVKQGVSVATQQSRWRARYRSDIDSSMRIIVNGVTYQIVGGPAELGNHEGVECVLERYSS